MGWKVDKVWFIGRVALLGMLLASGFLLFGCGGGSGSDSYDDPDADYLSGNVESSLIEVATLIKWDENAGVRNDGLYQTDQGERVVLIDAIDETANIAKYYVGHGHIPGAIINLSHEWGEAMNRNDGPVVEPHDASDGPAIDKLIQRLGITKDDVVVLTTSKMDIKPVASDPTNVIYDFCSTRLFWTMKYWGFSNAKLKVLNGSNDAWKAAPGTVMSYSVPTTPAPSTFSVKSLPGPNLHLRTTMGEVFNLVDSGAVKKLAGAAIILDMRQPLVMFDDEVDCPQATTSKGGMAFDGIIKGAVTIPTTSPITTWKILDRTGGIVKYRSKEVIKAAFDAAGIDGTKPIVINCNSGASAARYWYALSEILGYSNVSIFDASMQVWQTMSAYQPGTLDYVRYDSTSPNYTHSQFFYWDDVTRQFLDANTKLPVPPGSIMPGGNLGGDDTWDTVKRSEKVTFRPTKTVNDATVGKTYNALGSAGVANADQDWMPITADPGYRGHGSETKVQDAAYHSGAGSSSAPTATGGGSGGGC